MVLRLHSIEKAILIGGRRNFALVVSNLSMDSRNPGNSIDTLTSLWHEAESVVFLINKNNIKNHNNMHLKITLFTMEIISIIQNK